MLNVGLDRGTGNPAVVTDSLRRARERWLDRAVGGLAAPRPLRARHHQAPEEATANELRDAVRAHPSHLALQRHLTAISEGWTAKYLERALPHSNL